MILTPNHRRQVVTLVAVLSALLPAHAGAQLEREEQEEQSQREEGESRADWFGPLAGDVELRVSGDASHLFGSTGNGFQLQVGVGYFFGDWFEVGLSGGLGYSEAFSGVAVQQQGNPLVAGDVSQYKQGLMTVPILVSGGGWFGSISGWARLFVLSFDRADPLVPEWLDPFFGIELGSIFAERIDPYVSFVGSIGVNFYLTDQVALAPELGFGLIHTTDALVRFDDSTVDLVLGVSWSLSYFFG